MSLVTLRQHAASQGLSLEVIAGEALQVVILDALFAFPGSELMGFQGGTCLHLVHGGHRHSEDLDLAGADLDAAAARRIVERARPEVEKLSIQLLGSGEPAWKEPGPRGRVATHWFHFTPEATGRRIRVKIELARFPTYRAAVLPVRSELDLLRRQPLVRALQPPELLAEKVTAVLGRRYLKGRDLFDLWYLETVLRTPLDAELLGRKLEDYGVEITGEHLAERIAAVGAADIGGEMERFLPRRQREQLGAEGYAAVRRSAQEVLQRVAGAVGLPPGGPEPEESS
jgi:predicted nucleotidyltransferase component of viral defense system